MTELERKIKAKIPGPDTGIEVRHTICDICSPGMHCGINAYIKDGKVIKIEGIDGHPSNDGRLCTKGLSNRQYIYREDRVLTPLKRVGKRGEGKFEPITWDEAYAEIAKGLNAAKAKYGAESVAFYSGYSKWYRQMLRRLAYAFGSPNYGCESSACYTAAFMAWKVAAGEQGRPDMANSDLFLGWAFNPFYSSYMKARRAMALKEKGLKFLIVDTRRTPASEKLADLFLQPRTGTDGALAHAIANVLIQNGWIDKPYIDKYVYGFDEYAEYVSQFNESNIEQLTDVPYSQVVEAAKLIHENKRISCNESSAPCAITATACRTTAPSWHCSPLPATLTARAASCSAPTAICTLAAAGKPMSTSTCTRPARRTSRIPWALPASRCGTIWRARCRPWTCPARSWRARPTRSALSLRWA